MHCIKEPTNEVNKNVVAVVCTNSYYKEEMVGHVQQSISFIVSSFLSLPHSTLGIFATKKCINSESEYGLDIRANVNFGVYKKIIKLAKK